jgi:carboxymethylenebutenolidase
VDVTFHHYPGTTHAFFNDHRPEVHHREAADRSWQRTLAFLRDHLGGG